MVTEPIRVSQRETIRVFTHALPPTMGYSPQQWLEEFRAKGIDVDETMQRLILRELRPTKGILYPLTVLHLTNPKGGDAYYADIYEAQHRYGCMYPVPLEAMLMIRLYSYSSLLNTFSASSLTTFYKKEFSSTMPWLRIDICHRFDTDHLLATASETRFGKIGSGCFLGYQHQ